MTLRSRLRGAAINAYLGADAARHGWAALKRKVAGGARAVDFYFDLADPGSYLAAEAAERLAAAYPIELRFHLVSPPASDVDPAPALRVAHAVRDAAEVAARYDLEFPGRKPLDSGALKRGYQVLIKARPPGEQLAVARAVATALWTGDSKQLTALMGQHGHEDSMSVPPYLATHYDQLRRAGFFTGGSFHYDGDWYLGVERLHYLEARLRADTGTEAAPVVKPRANPEPPPPVKTRTLEVWFSYRSPYSYLAIAQLGALVDELGVELRLRPVVPLVARGAQMPTVKRLYLARDAHREAARLGIPFGHISDPLGTAVEHALAITRVAIARGRGLAFAESAMRGIWAEARDLADYQDLRAVVERAGLDWAEARAAVTDDAWRTEAADAAADLNAAGLWGVPSFRLGDHATWGQDRLPYLRDRLRG